MPELPPAIAAYFDAAPDGDAVALGKVFTSDAHVHDESHDYDGIDAIQAWRIDTDAKTPSTARPLELVDHDGRLVVSVEVTGTFPGSPITLTHTFTLVDARVASLDIR